MTRATRFSLMIVSIAVLADCGANRDTANVGATLTLTSHSLMSGQPIPVQYTCDGANQPPRLNWGDPSGGTKSFALVVDDPDAPGGTFHHWGVYDIPATARSIGGGQRAGTEVTNDFGKQGYGGPCPPKGNGPHHYHFKLFALSIDHLRLPSSARIADLENAAKAHAIGEGELVGTYRRR